ncbi:MAG: phosphomannomutase/phosphoglucomutase [Clostridia bacterium]|nr:phosphomannomutase/phosphoglucomutase [Clostridia bacterium]
MSIYKDCDIRGIYLKELKESDAYFIGRALSTYARSGAFCVGGDFRLSTPALKKNLIKGLNDSGSDVYDLGFIATPMMYYALRRDGDKLAGGAMVTASHNPPEYNGIKFMLGDSPVTKDIIDRIKRIVESGDFANGSGKVTDAEIAGNYISSMTDKFHAPKPLKVVVDAGNGSMSNVAPVALRNAGYDVVELFCEPDGTFPNRTPNPAQYDKLTAVCETVINTRADMGVAFDADGDRAVFIDDAGKVVISEKSLVLFIKWLLDKKPTSVVYDQKSSSIVKKAVLDMGGTPIPERSGHTFIKRHFLEAGSAIAGEVSGHFFFGELGYDDALFATFTLLQALECWNISLSQAAGEIPCPPLTPDLRFPCAYSKQEEKLAEVRAAFPQGEVSLLDGVRIELDDGWLLVRKSVTAEEITLRAEGRDEHALNAILEKLSDVFEELKRR